MRHLCHLVQNARQDKLSQDYSRAVADLGVVCVGVFISEDQLPRGNNIGHFYDFAVLWMGTFLVGSVSKVFRELLDELHLVV